MGAGQVAPGFEQVGVEFERNFAERGCGVDGVHPTTTFRGKRTRW